MKCIRRRLRYASRVKTLSTSDRLVLTKCRLLFLISYVFPSRYYYYDVTKTKMRITKELGVLQFQLSISSLSPRQSEYTQSNLLFLPCSVIRLQYIKQNCLLSYAESSCGRQCESCYYRVLKYVINNLFKFFRLIFHR